MEYVAHCSDGVDISVPKCASKYLHFFEMLENANETDFWAKKEANIPYSQPDPVIKTFNAKRTENIDGQDVLVPFKIRFVS